MTYYYQVVDLATGNISEVESDIHDFDCYRDFIAYLEANNVLWAGTLRFQESRKRCLTSEYEMV